MSDEKDPNGRDAHSAGAKLDLGKTQPDLIMSGFANALQAVAEVATDGAEKYTPHGWATVPDGVRRYDNAKFRHHLARARGEERDIDSGLLHRAHEAWNALATLELLLREASAYEGPRIPETVDGLTPQPEWANWLAVDGDSRIMYWLERKPRKKFLDNGAGYYSFPQEGAAGRKEWAGRTVRCPKEGQLIKL